MSMILAVMLIIGSGNVKAATFTVTSTADTGSGTLRQALLDASDGDVIEVALAGCPCVITLYSGSLQTSRSVNIIGPGADMLTLDGNGGVGIDPARRLILETGGTLYLEGITFANSGTGIFNSGNLYLKNVAIRDHHSTGTGGGISNLGYLTVVNSSITNNHTTVNGGGIGNVGTATIINSTISGNTADRRGGGIHTAQIVVGVPKILRL